MIPLPDWAPNVHPLIVHFPIALLFVAVFLDLVALIVKKRPGFGFAADSLFVLGAVSALVAFLTGRAAADEILLPTAAQAVLTDHADWATLSVWFFGVYALGRLALLGLDRARAVWIRTGMFLIGAAGLFLVGQTAEYGAKMVFKYGVGVQAVATDDFVPHDHETSHDDDDGGDHGSAEDHHAEDTLAVVRPTFTENGSWAWSPGPGAAHVFRDEARFIAGSLENLIATGRDSALALELNGGSAMFVIGDDLESIEAELTIDGDLFDGTIQLVHHVQDARTFDFLAVKNGMLRQGRNSQEEIEVFDEKDLTVSGWLELRAVSDGRHFRGYVGEEMLVHGHGSEPAPGPVGVRLEGRGTVLIRGIGVQSLR